MFFAKRGGVPWAMIEIGGKTNAHGKTCGVGRYTVTGQPVCGLQFRTHAPPVSGT